MIAARSKSLVGAVKCKTAFLKAIKTRRGVERPVDVLLDQNDRRALSRDGVEALIDVANDDRRQSERQLVAQQQPRIGHQAAADRRHLLLPARQRRRGQVAQFMQARKQLVDALEIPRPGALAVGAEQKILLDRKARKQPASFRHHCDAQPHDLVRRLAPDRLTVEHHHLRRSRQSAGDRAQKRGLAGAVGADDGDRLALLDGDIDVEQRLEVAVEGGEILRSAAAS